MIFRERGGETGRTFRFEVEGRDKGLGFKSFGFKAIDIEEVLF
jgi:hypothetical protein